MREHVPLTSLGTLLYVHVYLSINLKHLQGKDIVLIVSVCV